MTNEKIRIGKYAQVKANRPPAEPRRLILTLYALSILTMLLLLAFPMALSTAVRMDLAVYSAVPGFLVMVWHMIRTAIHRRRNK